MSGFYSLLDISSQQSKTMNPRSGTYYIHSYESFVSEEEEVQKSFDRLAVCDVHVPVLSSFSKSDVTSACNKITSTSASSSNVVAAAASGTPAANAAAAARTGDTLHTGLFGDSDTAAGDEDKKERKRNIGLLIKEFLEEQQQKRDKPWEKVRLERCSGQVDIFLPTLLSSSSSSSCNNFLKRINDKNKRKNSIGSTKKVKESIDNNYPQKRRGKSQQRYTSPIQILNIDHSDLFGTTSEEEYESSEEEEEDSGDGDTINKDSVNDGIPTDPGLVARSDAGDERGERNNATNNHSLSFIARRVNKNDKEDDIYFWPALGYGLGQQEQEQEQEEQQYDENENEEVQTVATQKAEAQEQSEIVAKTQGLKSDIEKDRAIDTHTESDTEEEEKEEEKETIQNKIIFTGIQFTPRRIKMFCNGLADGARDAACAAAASAATSADESSRTSGSKTKNKRNGRCLTYSPSSYFGCSAQVVYFANCNFYSMFSTNSSSASPPSTVASSATFQDSKVVPVGGIFESKNKNSQKKIATTLESKIHSNKQADTKRRSISTDETSHKNEDSNDDWFLQPCYFPSLQSVTLDRCRLTDRQIATIVSYLSVPSAVRHPPPPLSLVEAGVRNGPCGPATWMSTSTLRELAIHQLHCCSKTITTLATFIQQPGNTLQTLRIVPVDGFSNLNTKHRNWTDQKATSAAASIKFFDALCHDNCQIVTLDLRDGELSSWAVQQLAGRMSRIATVPTALAATARASSLQCLYLDGRQKYSHGCIHEHLMPTILERTTSLETLKLSFVRSTPYNVHVGIEDRNNLEMTTDLVEFACDLNRAGRKFLFQQEKQQQQQQRYIDGVKNCNNNGRYGQSSPHQYQKVALWSHIVHRILSIDKMKLSNLYHRGKLASVPCKKQNIPPATVRKKKVTRARPPWWKQRREGKRNETKQESSSTTDYCKCCHRRASILYYLLLHGALVDCWCSSTTTTTTTAVTTTPATVVVRTAKETGATTLAANEVPSKEAKAAQPKIEGDDVITSARRQRNDPSDESIAHGMKKRKRL